MTKVSLVVPYSKNSSPRDLGKLVSSIASQTYEDIEAIVVSDTDYTSQDFTQPWLRFVSSKSIRGASAARNHGAKLAKGEILGFLDDDVVLDPCWCEEAVNSFEDERVGAVSGESLVPVESYGLDCIPKSLMWVVGGSYWNSSKPIAVRGGAGMNFAVKKEVFDRVGGYNQRFGPRGDRPEVNHWDRLGAEETDLALRISRECSKIVLFNPYMKVSHKLRRESASIVGIVKRAMHVGRNRAYIRSTYGDAGFESDYFALTGLCCELTDTLTKFSVDPLLAWKRFSFSAIVLLGICLGYSSSILAFRSHLSSVDWSRT